METPISKPAVNIVDTVTAIVARELATASAEAIGVRIRRAISGLPDMDTNLLEQRWFEYDIGVEANNGVDLELRILESMRSLDIAAAPEVAAVIPFDDRSVIIRRYWACPSERLVPAESVLPFDTGARERLLRDMSALASHGKRHAYAKGLAHWFVGERTHTIVLNQWITCEEATPEECEHFVRSIERTLARRA